MASEVPHPPSSSSSAADSYIGRFISLISMYEIRYEGVLYHLNVKDSTMGLKNVKSYGTEGRRRDGPQIPPSDKVYEFILFRGSDIKDLQVKSSPPAKAEEQSYRDPANIQTHCKGAPFSSPPVTCGGKSQCHDTPAVISRVKLEETHPCQAGIYLSSSHQTLSAQTQGASIFSTPFSSQSCNGNFISPIDGVQHGIPSLSQPSALVPGTVQNQVLLSENQSSATDVLTSTSEGINPVTSYVTTFLVHPMPSSSQIAMQPFKSPVVSSSTTNLPLSLDSPLIPLNSLAMPSMANSLAVSDYSMAYPAASPGNPTSGPLPTLPPCFMAPNQLSQPGYSVPSQMQKFYSDKEIGTRMPAPTGAFSLVSSQTPREPMLPLPTSAPQQVSSAPFTEEFDFETMNEKFKKDEVWGALGKLDKTVTAETDDSIVGQSFVGRESDGLTMNRRAQPAYKKDDFFDTISCNALSQGTRTSQNRFSERMKMDAETFGNFRVRPPRQSYGVYGVGRGQNNHSQCNWGRGYGCGGRLSNRSMPK